MSQVIFDPIKYDIGPLHPQSHLGEKRGQLPSASFVRTWRSFLEENRDTTPEDVDRELLEIHKQHGSMPAPVAPRQRKRKSATIADLAGAAEGADALSKIAAAARKEQQRGKP